jgi:hypothetical protein
VDLRADVAVGARNPMKVAGVAQDFGGVESVNLEGRPKSRGVRIVSAVRSDPRNAARP